MHEHELPAMAAISSLRSGRTMRIIVINLDQDTERRERVERRLRQLGPRTEPMR